MQLTDNNAYMTHCSRFSADTARDRATQPTDRVSGRLLVLLSSCVLLASGPSVLDTVAQAGLVSLRILFEICNFGLVAYQIFGR
jgi:hypothetical protein